jgi:hypothetical protein
MSGTDASPAKLPSDGIKGLAMMAPVVGLPLFIHALGGVVISGVGFAALTSAMSPFREEILKAVNGIGLRNPDEVKKAVPASSVLVPVSITVADREPTRGLL